MFLVIICFLRWYLSTFSSIDLSRLSCTLRIRDSIAVKKCPEPQAGSTTLMVSIDFIISLIALGLFGLSLDVNRVSMLSKSLRSMSLHPTFLSPSFIFSKITGVSVFSMIKLTMSSGV